MKRVFVAALMLITLFTALSPYVNAEATKEKGDRFAVLDIDSGAAMGNINYFVLRPVMEYDSKEGVAVGTMFDGVVFSVSNAPANGSEAENIITTLFKDGTCIPAADTVAGEMKEDDFLDKAQRYPIYVTIPYAGNAFATEKEKTDFCRYYLDTLVSVFNSKKYQHVSLKGVYLSLDYDSDPTLRRFCVNLAKEKGLLSIVSTAIGGDIENAKVFVANKRIDDQLEAKTEGKGYTLTLDGVPDDKSAVPYDSLMADYKTLRKSQIGKTDLIFKFRAYNDLYDCASAIENTVPNVKARSTYDLVKEIIDCVFDESYTEIADSPSDTNWFYYVSAVFAVLGTVGILYLVYVFIKKGKSNG